MKIVQFLLPGLIAAAGAPTLDAHCHKFGKICRPHAIILAKTKNQCRAAHRRQCVQKKMQSSSFAKATAGQPKIKTSATYKAMPRTKTCLRAQYHIHRAGHRGRCVKLASVMHRHMHRRCRK